MKKINTILSSLPEELRQKVSEVLESKQTRMFEGDESFKVKNHGEITKELEKLKESEKRLKNELWLVYDKLNKIRVIIRVVQYENEKLRDLRNYIKKYLKIEKDKESLKKSKTNITYSLPKERKFLRVEDAMKRLDAYKNKMKNK